jgi:hypothetical protein
MAEPTTFSVPGADGAAAAGGSDAGAAGAITDDAAAKAAADPNKADDAANAATDDQANKDKADTDKKAADEQAAKDAAAKALLFDSVADLKLPDGVMVDDAMAKKFTDWAKANGMTKEQAQAAADLHLETVGVFAQKLQEEAQAKVKGWGEEITKDKELGGAKVKDTIATAEKFFGLAAKVPGVNVNRLQQDLMETGIANHPDMIRMAHYIGQQLGDDNLFITDRSSAGGEKDAATILYGETGVKAK